MYNTIDSFSFDLAMPRSNITSLSDRTSPLRPASLVARVTQFYHRSFIQSAEGMAFLTRRCGIRDVGIFKKFQIGLANGSLVDVLPQDDETKEQLKTIGLLTNSGAETLRDRLIFPLCEPNGAIVNLLGVRMDLNQHDAMFLAGPRGVWNAAAAKRGTTLLVVDSILDALAAIAIGMTETVFCQSEVGLSDEQLAHFEASAVNAIGICFSDANKALAAQLTEQLAGKPIVVKTIQLPDGASVIDYLNSGDRLEQAQQLRALVSAAFANNRDPSLLHEATGRDGYERTASGFKIRFDHRHYEVKGIARQPTQLKATVKATIGGAGTGQFALATLDLYSARSREAFGKECLAYFKTTETVIRADLNTLLEYVEAWKPDSSATADVPAPSPEELKAAEAFLRNPDLFAEILSDLETLGVTGEETNKLLCYIAAVSRKLDDPLSLLIQSRLAAGKSALQNAITRLVPDEDKAEYTRLTSQALFYQDEFSLAHKLLVLEEAEGLGEAAYSLRALQSAKKITVATTTKDPLTGRLRTDAYHVEGPIAVLLTTTRQVLDEETQSRFLVLTIDESAKATETILRAQRHRDTLAGYLAELDKNALIAKHHTAQRMLESVVVINPFAEQLTFPANGLRARRDQKKYLMLIKSVAFLFQKQRTFHEGKRGDQTFKYIQVTPDDIRVANGLAAYVLRHANDELSAPARTLLKLIGDLVKAHSTDAGEAGSAFVFTRRQVREATGWSDWQMRTHLKELEDLEYLVAKLGSRGKEYQYELNSIPEALSVDLVDPDTLKATSR
jgi:DNA primase